MSGKRRRMPGAIASLFSIGLVLAVMSCANDETEKLIKASKEGRLEELARVLNSGADVNAKTTDGWTALRRAQTVGHLDIVVLLRASGAKE